MMTREEVAERYRGRAMYFADKSGNDYCTLALYNNGDVGGIGNYDGIEFLVRLPVILSGDKPEKREIVYLGEDHQEFVTAAVDLFFKNIEKGYYSDLKED